MKKLFVSVVSIWILMTCWLFYSSFDFELLKDGYYAGLSLSLKSVWLIVWVAFFFTIWFANSKMNQFGIIKRNAIALLLYSLLFIFVPTMINNLVFDDIALAKKQFEKKYSLDSIEKVSYENSVITVYYKENQINDKQKNVTCHYQHQYHFSYGFTDDYFVYRSFYFIDDPNLFHEDSFDCEILS